MQMKLALFYRIVIAKKIHKNFTDPSKLNNGLYNKEFEKVRDQIKSFIINFIKEELI
jgi:hypothetical protein